MNHIQFISDPFLYNRNDAFVARLPSEIDGKQKLLDEIKIHLAFPDYFGFNWDALLECLQDFHWIEKKLIVLVHQDLPVLNETDLKTYFEILKEAANSWKTADEHNFEIVFSQKDLERVSELME